jgi:PAS domain S-box-containing protein
MISNGQPIHAMTPKVDEKRATQEYARRASELEVVAQVSTAITSILDLPTLLQTVVDLAKERFALYHAHIYVLSDDGAWLELAAGAGEPGKRMVADGHRIAFNRQQSLVARAARTRQGVTVNDVTTEPDFLPNRYLPNTHAELAVPMVVGDQVIGVLDVQSEIVGRFSDEDIRIKTILAQQVAVAIVNARAFETTERQLQLQEANANIAEYLRIGTEDTDELMDDVLALLLQVFEAESVVMSRYDHLQHLWYGVTGVGNDMTRELARTFVDAGPHYPHAVEAMHTGKVVVVNNAHEYPHFPKEYLDDKLGLKSVMVMPLTINNRVDGVIFVNFVSHYHTFTEDEITLARSLDNQISISIERREAAQKLRDNEARFRSLVSNIPGVIYRCLADENWTMQYISENVLTLSGYPASDFINNTKRSFASIIHPDDAQAVSDMVLEKIAEENPYTIEYRILHADGHPVWVRESGRAVHEQGTMWLDGAVFDITERKNSELVIESERANTTALARNLEVVAEVASTTANILDMDLLLEQVVELTKARFELYHAHIYLLDETGEWLVLAAGAGNAGRLMKERGHRIPLNHPNSIVARVAREQKGMFANDISLAPDFLPNPLLPLTQSENAAPIVVAGQLIGVLDVQSEKLNRFNEIDVLTKTTLAEQVGVALQNARAFTQLVQTQAELTQSLEARQHAEAQVRRRAGELETVAMVSAAASTVLDIEELLITVVELTKANFDLYHAHIYLIDDLNKYINLAAGAGEPGQMMKARGHRIAYNHPNSLVARAARSGHGALSNNVSLEPDFLPNPLLPETNSEMALPMISGDAVIGVLDVQSEHLNRFTEDDILVYTTLASQIAVAIQNARAIEQIVLHERAIENSTSGLTIADARQPDLPLIYINPAFEKITGYSIQEALNKNCRFLQAEDNQQEALDELRTAINEGRNCTVTLRNYRKDGTLFWNELRLSPIHNVRGEVTHFVGVQTDITERKEIEFQRELMLRQAEEQAVREREAADRLRDVDRLKSQFLANMSHELRTPLNSIIGYSEVLIDGDDGELSEEAVEDINIIYQSGRHLLSIINEILDLAKIEAGQMSIDARPTDIARVVEEVMQASQVLLKNKAVELRALPESPIGLLHADPIRLRQILLNLVSNGIKFTEKGSVSIAYGQADEHNAWIEVRDTGMGMSKTDLGIIFQQFRQVDGSSTRRAGGTGLGLTITKHLVELHHGHITVDSEVGVGTTFRIIIPLHVEQEAVPA